jgi:hypothetical protein
LVPALILAVAWALIVAGTSYVSGRTDWWRGLDDQFYSLFYDASFLIREIRPHFTAVIGGALRALVLGLLLSRIHVRLRWFQILVLVLAWLLLGYAGDRIFREIAYGEICMEYTRTCLDLQGALHWFLCWFLLGLVLRWAEPGFPWRTIFLLGLGWILLGFVVDHLVMRELFQALAVDGFFDTWDGMIFDSVYQALMGLVGGLVTFWSLGQPRWRGSL